MKIFSLSFAIVIQDLGEIENVDHNEALNTYTIGFKTRQEAEFVSTQSGL